MKIRSGFVSNSSSSSFAVSLHKLTVTQLCQILNHEACGAELGVEYAASDPWNISVKNGVLYGDTWMDNFNMEEFLEKIGVADVEFGEFDSMLPNDEAEAEPCDSFMCEKCQMRFVCYTNRWERNR